MATRMKGMLAMVVCLAACTQPTGECYDCGPCGLAGGPNGADSIAVLTKGVDEAGTPTIELGLWKQGECAGGNRDTYWLRFEGGTILLEQRTAPGGLDDSVVTYDGTTYSWSEPPLQMTTERDRTETVFHFTEDGATTDVGCSIDARTVVCAVL